MLPCPQRFVSDPQNGAQQIRIDLDLFHHHINLHLVAPIELGGDGSLDKLLSYLPRY